MTKSLIHVEHVKFSYTHKTILDDINFSIQFNDFVSLLGPNGSGKTTLIKIILGLLDPLEGEIKLFGQNLKEFKDWGKIGYVSQKASHFNHGFPATVYEVVAMGLTKKIGYFRFLTKKYKNKVDHALKQVEMFDYKHERIGNLSGGQQQRVFIARALVNNPKLLILDEPTVGIDPSHVERFLNLLKVLNQKGITILLITHDLQSIENYVSKVIFLNQTIQFNDDLEKFNELSKDTIFDMYHKF